MEFSFNEVMKILDESSTIAQAKQKTVMLNQKKKRRVDEFDFEDEESIDDFWNESYEDDLEDMI